MFYLILFFGSIGMSSASVVNLTTFADIIVNISSYEILDNNAIVLYIQQFFHQIGNSNGPLTVRVKHVTRCNGAQCTDQLPPIR
ncbi:hypothetical protein UPYG_G00039560 [Umbra pygmaea]|uniref:Uncharacterized protein n=1 Tax=Umbra pygmaea TaxID=75934 RepID=A0ABD0YDQ5_UMBPY